MPAFARLVTAFQLISAACVTALVADSTALATTEIPLGEGSVLRFADVAEGVAALTERDDYIRQLSPFDRQVRPKTDREVSEEEFLKFLGSHVLPWTPQDIQKLTPLVTDVARKIAPWKLPLPEVVLLVKTSGGEEGAAAYCRGPAIVLPKNMVDGPTAKLANILPHELFHVLSNQNPELRQALYASIGFQPCNEVELPPSLATRKITNPDAPLNNHYITVMQDGQPVELMPLLFANAPRYDAARGGNLFSYLTFRLMQVNDVDGQRRPVLAAGEPVLLDPAAVPGYHEQIGRNTKYIIHPEEVLADNFVYLIDDKQNLPSPQVVKGMADVFRAAAEKAVRPSL
jgi:hypothetical protein